jgi:hypothetical protein
MDLEAKKPLRRVWNAFLGRPQPDGFRDVVSKYSLDVERISPVHGVGLAQGQATLMRAQAEDLLKGGTARARTLQGRAREGELPSRVPGAKQVLLKERGAFWWAVPRPPQIRNRDAMELAAIARMGAKGGYSGEGHFKSQRGQL